MRRLTLLVLVALLVAMTAFLAGAVLHHEGVFPVPGMTRRITALYDEPPKVIGRRIESTLLSLELKAAVDVPPPSRGEGGGLTSLGDELVLLDNDGRLFSLRNGKLAQARVTAPDNGHADYVQTANRLTPQGYSFNLNRLRYNDVLVLQHDGARHLLVSFVEWLPARQCYRNTVSQHAIPDGARSILDLAAQPAWQRVFHTEPCLPLKQTFRALEGHMSGGKLTDLGNGRIAMTSGDFHWDGVYGPFNIETRAEIPMAQDPQGDYGKVLEIDLKTGQRRIVSVGNRNMQGIATTADGALWTVEHGPRGGDELNLHLPGRNHGWPLQTYGTQYSQLPWPGALPYGRHDRFDPPAFAWVPSVAVSGLTRITGFDPAWDGDLLASSLKANSLFRIRVQDGRAVYAEPIPVGYRIRAVHQHSTGEIALWTDSSQLVLLTTSRGSLASDFAKQAIQALPADEAVKVKVGAALAGCMECHSLQDGVHDGAPSLGSLWQRRVGSTSYAATSAALKHKGGLWDQAALEGFLSDPQAFAPGTTMPNPQLADPKVRSALISVLEKVSKTVE